MARRPLIVGLSAGTLALGANYLAHALFAVPLLPEQAGYILLKLLPLSTFESLLKALGLVARPLLLVGATVVIIASYGGAARLMARLVPRGYVWPLTGLAAVVSAVVAMVALSPSDSPLGVAVEVVLLAGLIPLVDRVFHGLARPAPLSEDRRILMRNLFYGAVGIALLGIGYANVRRFATALALKEGTRTPTEVTPVSDFYVVSKNIAGDPVVNASTWRLNLPGKSVTYEELLALPSHQLELTLECISNEIGGTLIGNGIWKGPRVSDVLALTSLPSNATWMLMESADGYTESFQLRELTSDHLLATHLNGAPLSSMHGFPARFIFPGRYGMKQPKWVTRIAFSASDKPGYWENNGWDERAIVKTMSRIDRPADGAALAAGSVQFGGIAFAGSRGVSGVELSWDGGRTWQPAELQAEFSPYAWRFWQLSTSIAAGHYNVKVRARDGEGTLQSSKSAATLPNGADGYHTITLDLA
ncbi:MAG: molybdopterin-dependent oxidoreductase [Candidatus Dormibacteraeota bacterium]|nr:molybdopterin-dependent oxidoreductase [Candidatus Dormibacteraeota bacterium]